MTNDSKTTDPRVESAARALARAFDCDLEKASPAERRNFKGYANAALAAADAVDPRKPRTITTIEELDALPHGAVVISPEYRHYRNGMQVSFQKWDDGRWYRGGRGRDTHPDYFLPATVLHEPEAEATR